MSIYAKTRPNPHIDLSGESRPKVGYTHVYNDSLQHYDTAKMDTSRITSPAASLAPRSLGQHLSWLENEFGYTDDAKRFKLPPMSVFDRKRPNRIYYHEGTEYHSAEASAIRAINDARRGLPRSVAKTGQPPDQRMVEPSGWREYGLPNGLVSAQNKDRWVGIDKRPTTSEDLRAAKEDAGPGFLPRVFNYFQ